MRCFQDYLEKLKPEELMELANQLEKKDVESEMDYYITTLGSIYVAETGEDLERDSVDELGEALNELFQRFKIGVNIYVSVKKGDMKINSGRMKLTNGDDAKLSLTEAGIKSVEKMLGK